jgi:hypothetical protein
MSQYFRDTVSRQYGEITLMSTGRRAQSTSDESADGVNNFNRLMYSSTSSRR